ncbi:MAG: sigma factor [Planctomycetota bacterium]|jgi:RNA polymerase sigma-70 factor (ECF subfamily)|nr:sigma factor [Planctomycetota bacterium]
MDPARQDELVAAARAGDGAAFDCLVSELGVEVMGVLLSRVRDWDLAEELTQEPFVIAWRKLADYRGEARFAAWVKGIARNLARGIMRTGAVSGP